MTGPVRVLVADQHAVWREGLRVTFARLLDLRIVAETGHAREVADLADRVRSDVVLLDPTMPVLGRPAGPEICRTVRARCPQVRVLMLSPVEDDRCVTASMDAGAAGYLGKDVDVPRLVASVRSVAAGRRRVVDRRSAGALMRVPAGQDRAELTARQLEVLRLLARGLSNRDIADRLILSEATVKFHLAKIMCRLEVPGRAGAVYAASRRGLI